MYSLIAKVNYEIVSVVRQIVNQIAVRQENMYIYI